MKLSVAQSKNIHSFASRNKTATNTVLFDADEHAPYFENPNGIAARIKPLVLAILDEHRALTPRQIRLKLPIEFCNVDHAHLNTAFERLAAEGLAFRNDSGLRSVIERTDKQVALEKNRSLRGRKQKNKK